MVTSKYVRINIQVVFCNKLNIWTHDHSVRWIEVLASVQWHSPRTDSGKENSQDCIFSALIIPHKQTDSGKKNSQDSVRKKISAHTAAEAEGS